jgi:hypothetical protein
MLPKANPHYISKKLFEEFKLKIPKEIYSYIEKGNKNKQVPPGLLLLIVQSV